MGISGFFKNVIGFMVGGSATPVSADNPLPTASTSSTPAGENHLGAVSGHVERVSAELTRPADTSAYAALDCINNATSGQTLPTITNVARVNGGAGYIIYARLTTDNKNNTARHKVHLYNQTVTAVADNAPFPMLYVNKLKKVGEITFDAMSTEGSTSDCAVAARSDVFIPFKCDTGLTTLYWMLETLDSRTQVASENFSLVIGVDQQ